jgi:hypothetical protein
VKHGTIPKHLVEIAAGCVPIIFGMKFIAIVTNFNHFTISFSISTPES